MTDSSTISDAKLLSQEVTLPCGLKLPNRLVKASMAEILAPLGGSYPTESHNKLYKEWAIGKWGMILTGNVQVSSTHLGTPGDSCIRPTDYDSPEALSRWRHLAEICKSGGCPAIMQLCHTGRQSPRMSGRAPWTPSIAPSPVRLKTGKSLFDQVVSCIVFNEPREMTESDIEEVKEQFRKAAVLAKETGFDGIQLHCSHGYLLASFLSPKTNLRTDRYGGSPEARLRLILEIVDAIRADCPAPFCIGIKLNSADYVQGGLTEDEALQQVNWITEHGGVDFIEVSGGTYENAEMLKDDHETAEANGKPSNGDSDPKPKNRREAFFSEFSHRCKTSLPSSPTTPLIMVTGGFRTRTGMAGAVRDGSTDLIGLGRPSCVSPQLPTILLDTSIPDSEARAPKYRLKQASVWKAMIPIQIIGAGFNTIWHQWQILRIARGKRPDVEISILGGLLESYSPFNWMESRTLLRLCALFAVLFLWRSYVS